MKTLSDLYHRQADDLLDKATHTPSPEAREMLFQAAMIYERLAEDAEQDDQSR
jgi:hypothetical protein